MSNQVPWWRRAVVYQIYPRSFMDSNGDGIGDIEGMISKLDHLAELGVDAIWANPWYPSPLLDGGYDVADYREIDPRLGSVDDVRRLVEEAHARGIRILADLVPNHTSWEHEWFRAALEAGPGSPERERYIFRDGRGEGGSEPPNNWESVFGGPAWERVDDGQWYLHLFDRSQPDLNWEHQEVVDEFDDVLRYWFDLGIDGFRVDVAHSMIKAPGLPDMPHGFDFEEWKADGTHPYFDRDDVHDIIRRWRSVTDEYDDRMLIAEAYVTPERLGRFTRPDEFHHAFNFTFVDDAWRPHLHNIHIPQVHGDAAANGTTATWVWGNHDLPRPATRLGLPESSIHAAKHWIGDGPHEWVDDELGLRRARAAALMELALPGCAYVYMGEELGLREVWDLPDDARQDPEFFRSNRKGRDGCRVPLPWEAEAEHFGFGGEPWLPQPDDFRDVAVDQQLGVEGSTLELFRTAIRLRREHATADEELHMLDLGRDVVAFRRGSGLVCVVNMSTQPVALPEGQLLLASGQAPVDGMLPPDDAVWLTV